MPEPIHLHPDTDVTDVCEQLRRLPPGEVRLVVPPDSALAEARFNFQLLALNAKESGRALVIESADPRVLSFAAESGLTTRNPEAGSLAPAALAATPVATMPIPPPPPPPAPPPPPPLDEEYADYAAYDGDGEGAGVPSDADSEEAAPATPVAPGYVRGGPWRPDPWSTATAAPRAGRRRRVVLYAAAAALLLAGIVAVALLVPSATVTLTTPSTAFAQPVDLVAHPGTGPVTVRTVTVQKQESGAFQSSGVNTIPGAQASGTIQYQDNCGIFGQQLQIAQGAVVTSQSGVNFVQQQQVMISNGQTQTAPIQAQAAGSNGNVASGQITSLQNAGIYASCLHVTNPQATTGGQDPKQQPVVTQQDLTNAQAQLQQQAEQALQAQLTGEVRSGEKQSDQNPIAFGAPQFSADHPAGSTVQSFDATLTIKATSSYYQPSQVDAAFRSELQQRVPGGQQLAPGDFAAQYATTMAADGSLEFKGQAVGRIAPRLDLAAIRSHVAGRPTASARSYLHELPVSTATISQYPFATPLMPLLTSRISVDYVVQQPPTPAPLPAASPAAVAH